MANEVAVRVDAQSAAKSDGPFKLGTTSLKVQGKPTYEQWAAYRDVLARMEGAIQWWIGDWLNYGEHAYGEKYAQAVDETQAATWTVYASIARNVGMLIRINILSWHHHRLVAPLHPPEQRYWLKEAIKNKWSVHQLRVALRRAKLDTADWRAAGGEIWLYPGAAKDLLQEIPPQSVDLLLTDPPYMTDVPDIRVFAAEWLPLALTPLRASARAYICIGAYPEELAAYLDVLKQEAPLRNLTLANVLVWTYRNTLGPAPKHDYKLNWQAILYLRGREAVELDCPKMTEQFTVQDINAPDGRLGDRYHTWQKPDELAERFIRHATKPGDVVLDPFAGTGTFLLAAARGGRLAIGAEHDPTILEIAHERGCPDA